LITEGVTKALLTPRKREKNRRARLVFIVNGRYWRLSMIWLMAFGRERNWTNNKIMKL